VGKDAKQPMDFRTKERLLAVYGRACSQNRFLYVLILVSSKTEKPGLGLKTTGNFLNLAVYTCQLSFITFFNKKA